MSQHLIHMKETGTAQGMANAIREYLIINERMETQVLSMEEGGYLVQAREASGWKKFVGMDKAITVKINEMTDESVMLEIGQGKWSDKAVVATVSMFVLWPLALTSTYGTIKQAVLPNKILLAAEQYAAA